MHPHRRSKIDIRQKRQNGNDDAQGQHDKKCRSIAGVVPGKAELTHTAGFCNGEVTVKQVAFATARASRSESNP